MEEMLFYADEWQMENLYFLVYMNFVDYNLEHFRWRQTPVVDDWSEEEALDNVVDLIKTVMTESQFNTLDKVLEACGAKDDMRLADAVAKVTRCFEKKNVA